MHASTVLLSICASFTLVRSADLGIRDACATGYTLCAPSGATTTSTPQIGDSTFQDLFVDIVDSSLPASKRNLLIRMGASLCCVSSLDCLSMSGLQLPFCYDKFTTNFFLPDGSYGTVVGGNYTSAAGDTANLETGAYTLVNGTTGNIYADNEAAQPNTATLPMPSQFTASGVGSVIPASVLGGEVTITYTTTLPASTVSPMTIADSTISESIVPASTVLATTISTEVSSSTLTSVIPASTVSPSTQQASTLPGTTVLATTIQAVTSVVTTTVPASVAASSVSSTSSASATSNSSKTSMAGNSIHGYPLPALLLCLTFVWMRIYAI